MSILHAMVYSVCVWYVALYYRQCPLANRVKVIDTCVLLCGSDSLIPRPSPHVQKNKRLFLFACAGKAWVYEAMVVKVAIFFCNFR